MEINIVTIITSVLEAGGLGFFFYYVIKGLKKQVKIQNDTLITMERRISETEKIVDIYKKFFDNISDDIDKFTQAKSKLSKNSANNQGEISQRIIEEIAKKFDYLLPKEKKYEQLPNNRFKYSYSHSGWNHRDILLYIQITQQTNFIAHIKLNVKGQVFMIYFKIKTQSNKEYWIGYGGGEEDRRITSKEFSRRKNYDSCDIIINENIDFAFKLGFPNKYEMIKEVICIRLRGNKNDPHEIHFLFDFKDM